MAEATGSRRVSVDLRIYRLAAVKKTAYRLADRCTAVLHTASPDSVDVELRFRPGTTEAVATEVERQFFQELLDQELREHVAEETAPIRALVMAQAFSSIDVIKRES